MKLGWLCLLILLTGLIALGGPILITPVSATASVQVDLTCGSDNCESPAASASDSNSVPSGSTSAAAAASISSIFGDPLVEARGNAGATATSALLSVGTQVILGFASIADIPFMSVESSASARAKLFISGSGTTTLIVPVQYSCQAGFDDVAAPANVTVNGVTSMVDVCGNQLFASGTEMVEFANVPMGVLLDIELTTSKLKMDNQDGGSTVSYSISFVQTPEPGTYILTGIGLFLAAAAGRRLRARS